MNSLTTVRRVIPKCAVMALAGAAMCFLCLTEYTVARDQEFDDEAAEKIFYKNAGGTLLHLWFYNVQQDSEVKAREVSARPAIIFFHGGGLRTGSPQQFAGQARYLARYGIAAVSAEYRLLSETNVTPTDAIRDTKSAIRWLRSHAEHLHIDPSRIATAGGSAGGYLVLSAILAEDINEASDDATVQVRPDALVLFNPVVTSGKNRNKSATALSPLYSINIPLPPTIIFQGTADTTVSYAIIQEFVTRAKTAGSKDVRLVAYEGRTHGFFNRSEPGKDDYSATLAETVKFFQSLGWISADAARK